MQCFKIIYLGSIFDDFYPWVIFDKTFYKSRISPNQKICQSLKIAAGTFYSEFNKKFKKIYKKKR